MDRKQEILNEWPASIDEVVNKAAKHLPKGYTIVLKIEKDGYGVELETASGLVIDNIDGGDGLVSEVNEAICIANGFTSG